jgi:nitrile hydratase beta subunit
MTRVHDMGGRWGEGTIDTSDHGVFAEDWHARALGLTLAAGALGRWNIDAARHAREALAPQDYTRFSYYERWLAGLADLLVETGLVDRDELIGDPEASNLEPLRASSVWGLLSRSAPYAREGSPPRFAKGDAVRTRLPSRNTLLPGGHTRLPAYAAGHLGKVFAFRGCHVFPDSNAHGLGEAAQPLYTVAFSAADLWGEAERAGDEVMLDLWESYLEPA